MSGRAEEAKLQSQCVIWMWNTHQETRGLFFSVENEGVRISSKMVMGEALFIQNNLNRPQSILMACRKLMTMCKSGNAVGGAQAKAMGVTSGVSDCLFMWDSTTYCFEFKTPTGRQSEKQVWWQSVVELKGYKYFVVRDFETFTSIIQTIL